MAASYESDDRIDTELKALVKLIIALQSIGSDLLRILFFMPSIGRQNIVVSKSIHLKCKVENIVNIGAN